MSVDTSASETQTAAQELARYRRYGVVARGLVIAGAIGSVFMSVYIIFGLGPILGTFVPLETQYFYAMVALLLPLVFLLFPVTSHDRDRVPPWDWALALAAFAIPAYFVLQSDPILNEGWEYNAPPHAKVMAFVMWALVLEALRRAGGTAIFGSASSCRSIRSFLLTRRGSCAARRSGPSHRRVPHLQHRKHSRHPDECVRDPRHRLPRVRHRAAAHRRRRVLPQPRVRPARAASRRPGQGRHLRVGPDGLDVGQRHHQRADHRRADHSGDEAGRLPPGVCRPASRPARRPAAC
jgi:hypothetical protein